MSDSVVGEVKASISHWTVARYIVSLSPFAVAAILAAVFQYASPRFLSGSNLANIVAQAAPLFIVTIGQLFVMTVGGLDISVGGVAAFSSMVMAFGAIQTHSSFGLLLGLAAGSMLGAINGWIVTRFRINSIIVTIAMLSSAQGFAFLIGNGQPMVGLPASASWFGWGAFAGIPAPVILAIVAFIVAQFMLSQTDIGVKLRALGEGYDTARIIGLKARRLTILAFTVSGFTSALAAVIWTAQAGGGNPLVGSDLALQTIAAAVIGGVMLGKGTGSTVGAIGGALVITILSVGMDIAGVAPYTEQIALGVALILTLLFNRLQNRLQILIETALSRRARLS